MSGKEETLVTGVAGVALAIFGLMPAFAFGFDLVDFDFDFDLALARTRVLLFAFVLRLVFLADLARAFFFATDRFLHGVVLNIVAQLLPRKSSSYPAFSR